MSQTKAIVETIDIPVDQIRPSPYQPRLNFNLEDLRGTIKRDGILAPLIVREKEDYYELIDGERRIRLAKELGYETVPCTVIDVDDETADRTVWKVNTLRQDYQPEEKARHWKHHQDEGMSLRGIARDHDEDSHWVLAHLNVFKLPEKYQRLVWDRGSPLSVGHIRELEPLFTEGVAIATITNRLDLVIERRLTVHEFRGVLKPDLEEIKKGRIEAAKQAAREAAPEVMPEAKPLEAPEEFEEAAKALMEEAERRKTLEQKQREKHQKKVDAVLKSLLSGRASVPAKIEKAKKLGLDITEFEARMEAIKAEVDSDPEGMKDAVKALKKDIDEARKRRETEIKMEKKREAARKKLASFPKLGEHEDGVDVSAYKSKLAEIEGFLEEQPDKAVEALENLLDRLERDREREKIRKEEAEKARRRVEEELLTSKKFLRKAAEMALTIEELPEREEVATPPAPSPEEVEAVRERLMETRQRLREILERPEVKERGKLFRNWVAHQALLDVLGGASCPRCGATWENLEWKCHHLNVKEAYEIATEQYQESIKRGE